MPEDAVRIVVWAAHHLELAEAFKSWAGAGADLRVVFTPFARSSVRLETRPCTKGLTTWCEYPEFPSRRSAT